MPAPNIATLFDFESAYEDALAGYFANINGNPFSQILTPRTNISQEAELETPRLAILLAITSQGTHEQFITNSAVRYYSQRFASATLTVSTNRDNAAQTHGLLRGRIREGMLKVTAALNSNTVPYYQTIQVTEAFSAQGVAEENDEISTALTFAIEFAIKPAEWPTA